MTSCYTVSQTLIYCSAATAAASTAAAAAKQSYFKILLNIMMHTVKHKVLLKHLLVLYVAAIYTRLLRECSVTLMGYIRVV